MAAYAATVSSTLRHAIKVDNITGFGVYTGTIDLTNYNTTLAAITDITGKFKTVMSVTVSGTEDGYVLAWASASNAFKAFEAGADAAALDECANDTDCGVAHFIAYGII